MNLFIILAVWFSLGYLGWRLGPGVVHPAWRQHSIVKFRYQSLIFIGLIGGPATLFSTIICWGDFDEFKDPPKDE